MNPLDSSTRPRPFVALPDRELVRVVHRTPVGTLRLTGDGRLFSRLEFPIGADFGEPDDASSAARRALSPVIEQLDAYFAGELRSFDLDLAPSGTPFQLAVWSALCDVAYGSTASYKQIATAIGNERATRAVGMANNRNPLAIVVPCHRIVGFDGSLVGYGGGLAVKELLLSLEREYSAA